MLASWQVAILAATFGTAVAYFTTPKMDQPSFGVTLSAWALSFFVVLVLDTGVQAIMELL